MYFNYVNVCVIPLQWQYGNNTLCLSPSGGECKEICIENRSKRTLNSPVIKCCAGGFAFMILNKSGGFKEPLNVHKNINLNSFNCCHFSCDRDFKVSGKRQIYSPWMFNHSIILLEDERGRCQQDVEVPSWSKQGWLHHHQDTWAWEWGLYWQRKRVQDFVCFEWNWSDDASVL